MKNRSFQQIGIAAVSAVWLASGWRGLGIEPVQLKTSLEQGEPITIIDVRSTLVFQRDHITGAINVPASLVPEKRLPRLGHVVVCDDGLGRDSAAATAVIELNKKTGITAEALEGGYAAWQALRGPTTKPPGLHPEELNLISYDQLKQARRENLVLVDLRKPRPQIRQEGETNSTPPQPLTDLSRAFPGAAVTKSPFNLPQSPQSAGGQSACDPVLVLIDNGDGDAQETARTLKANGIMRVVILAGGETILSREGQPGLLRTGGQSVGSPPLQNSGVK